MLAVARQSYFCSLKYGGSLYDRDLYKKTQVDMPQTQCALKYKLILLRHVNCVSSTLLDGYRLKQDDSKKGIEIVPDQYLAFYQHYNTRLSGHCHTAV